MTELFLGIDLGGTHISTWLFDNKGKAWGPFTKVGINSQITSEELLKHLKELVISGQFSAQSDGRNIAAIGLSSPGPLDSANGVITSPPNLPNLRNLEVVNLLRARVGYKVFLINDADAAVLGEAWLGSAKGFKNVVMLTLGTGVGSGVIANGCLQRGRGMGGEWGHTTIQYSNEKRLCSCRRWNCLEAFCGTEGLARTYCNLFSKERNELSKEEVYKISENMMEHCKENWYLHESLKNSNWDRLFRLYCRHLTEGIINIANAHHPECIVLGGGIANKHIVEQVKKNFESPNANDPFGRRYKLAKLLEGLEVRLAESKQSNVIGAAKYGRDRHEAIIRQHRADHGVFS